MATHQPKTLHGLPVIHPEFALAWGYESITTDIHAETEKSILAGVCQHRNPERACLMPIRESVYQLAIRREDLSQTSQTPKQQ